MSITPLPRPHTPAEISPSADRDESVLSGGAEDSFLALAISRGEAAALEQLIGRYWEPLTSYASRVVGDMATAEDVVQKMFVALWSGRRDWSPRSVRAYLFRCTRNLALDERRSALARRRREERSWPATRPPTSPTPDALLDETTLVEAVDRAIDLLPDRRREAFVLAYLKGLSYREVAAVMGVSTKTVGHHVSAALAELRLTLGSLAEEHLGVASSENT